MAWSKAQRRIKGIPTDVYRVYDKENDLLYVGVSVNAFKRLREHAPYAEWWPRAHTAIVKRFETRRMARHVEALAIRDESPQFNVTREAAEERPRDVTPPIEVLDLWWDTDGDYWVDGEEERRGEGSREHSY